MWTDPQFYVVTAVAAWGAWAVLKPVLSSGKNPEAGCPSCSKCTQPFKARASAETSSKDSNSLVVLGRGAASSKKR